MKSSWAVFWIHQRRVVRDAKMCCYDNFVIKHIPKGLHKCVNPFLYIKANSKEIGEENSSHFTQKC